MISYCQRHEQQQQQQRSSGEADDSAPASSVDYPRAPIVFLAFEDEGFAIATFLRRGFLLNARYVLRGPREIDR